MSYYYSKILQNCNFEEAVEKTVAELKNEGFGVLTEINIDETLKKKINVDFKKYKILGACNPQFAYKALKTEDKIGLFLPCNFVVEAQEDGKIEVSAVNPIEAMSAVENEELGTLAQEIEQKIIRIIENLK